MADYLFRQEDEFGRTNQFMLSGITDTDVDTIVTIMTGKVKVFEGTLDTNISLEAKPDKLNTQVFSCGRKLGGGRYKRCSFTLRDMKDDKTVKDVRDKMASLDCHFDMSDTAEYVNLISDKKD